MTYAERVLNNLAETYPHQPVFLQAVQEVLQSLQPILDIQSEILSWAVVLLIVVVCFAVMQLVKPMLQKKKSTIQVVKSIKAFYYEVYKKNGLKKLEPWN